ncbi:hypothetical protein [cf. Phormidesmis sp. LEGE 11477]|uniref:hypothetical protein n=1 Tax=cf. Phormidesmis sp. LEGE 11477 TaxID=1828680 RepID=UPI0018822DA9|nr:hypothetical protein [cf. Phormidesmis sp. LEGE 11477]MBE9062148.1 hypothetical protein [cf. Phormidesmis sp. LEGE 11477]
MHTQLPIPESATTSDSTSLDFATINSVNLPLLLKWWQQQKRVAGLRSHLNTTLPKGDKTYLSAYYRLMEVYSVVKAGGVQAQKEAAEGFAERELSALNQRLHEIEVSPNLLADEKQKERAKIEQELEELRQANSWRSQMLCNITPAEESAVKAYLSDIEQTLMQTRCL